MPAPGIRERSSVDYALTRRATLADLRAGRASPLDVCDAHPYLLRAARFHGEPSGQACPVCRRAALTHVTYTYGDCFRTETNGRVRATAELAELAASLPEFTVYVVEVCQDCGWNHLVRSFVLGSGDSQQPRRDLRRSQSRGQNRTSRPSGSSRRVAQE